MQIRLTLYKRIFCRRMWILGNLHGKFDTTHKLLEYVIWTAIFTNCGQLIEMCNISEVQTISQSFEKIDIKCDIVLMWVVFKTNLIIILGPIFAVMCKHFRLLPERAFRLDISKHYLCSAELIHLYYFTISVDINFNNILYVIYK